MKGKVLIKGLPVSSGVVVGVVRVVDHDKDKMGQVQVGEIMVVSRTNPEDESFMKRAAAIVADKGGQNSHAAIVSREVLKIPCITGSLNATEILKDGQVVMVDGTEGVVYEYIGPSPTAAAKTVAEKPAPMAAPSLVDKMMALAKAKGIELKPEQLKKMKERGG